MQLVRSLAYHLLQAVTTPLFAAALVLAWPLPYRLRYRIACGWTAINLAGLRVLCGLDCRVHGREHLPDGPAVVACKHQSAFETLALTRILPPQTWLLKRELTWIPLFGWGLAALRPIAIDRSQPRRALRALVERGRERLAQGLWVVTFPEGTRVPPGEQAPFQPGGAMLAQRAGVPLVPIAHNAGRLWPRRGLVKHAGTVDIVIGPPLAPDGRRATELNRAAERWVAAETRRLESGTGRAGELSPGAAAR